VKKPNIAIVDDDSAFANYLRTLPRVGDLEASNRTPLEMRDSIAQQLKEYMMNPVVTVIVAGSQPATASSRSINSRSVVSHR
jgi:hypothetical protein